MSEAPIPDRYPQPAPPVASGKRSRRILVLWSVALGALVIAFASRAYANATIPGPLFHQPITMTEHPVRWLLCSMTMCIAVEGAIYHYQGLLWRPYIASGVANVGSFLIGFPLALLGAVLADLGAPVVLSIIIVPTVLGIASEVYIVRCFKVRKDASVTTKSQVKIVWADVGEKSKRKIIWAALIGNAVTHVILVAYMAIKMVR